jgi:hypothetical protein
MTSNTTLVSGGYLLVPGGVCVSEVNLGDRPGLAAGRGMRRIRVSGLPFTAAALVAGGPAKHVQVQTTPTIDFRNGVPPSATLRRT